MFGAFNFPRFIPESKTIYKKEEEEKKVRITILLFMCLSLILRCQCGIDIKKNG